MPGPRQASFHGRAVYHQCKRKVSLYHSDTTSPPEIRVAFCARRGGLPMIPLVTRSLHLTTLWGFAVAQPLFDLIGRNPTFLTAHQLANWEAVLLALVLAVVLPGGLALAVAGIGLVHKRTGLIVHLGIMGTLIALFVVQGLWRALPWPEALVSCIAILLALVSILIYRGYSGMRMFVTVLSPSVLLFPALFLFASPITPLFSNTGTAKPADAVAQSVPPIVFIVFDELPTTVLLDDDGNIDETRFPAFRALAESAYWFRNATTVHTRTEHAVPAMLTGVMPRRGQVRIPNASDFPDNLFTWAAPHYRIVASEPLTDLCPVRVCTTDVGMGSSQYHVILWDLAVVYLHLVLPPSIRVELPPINRAWGNFGGVHFDLHGNVIALNNQGRHRQVARFIDVIEPSPTPTLYFMHTNLPHLPYEYLPGGERYFMHTRIRGFRPGAKLDTWTSDPTALYDAYTRFVAQTRYVDKIVGELVAHLKKIRVYDDSLLIITADHGVSIRADDLRRGVTEVNQRDIAGVPLFIKVPGQSDGKTSDRNVESIDIVPSIATIVGVPLTWHPDGTSLFDRAHGQRRYKTLIDGNKLWELPADLMVGWGGGAGDRPTSLVSPQLTQGLLNRPVAEFDVRAATGIKASLKRAELFRDVDFEQFLPAHVQGDLQTDGEALADVVIAIAVNGTIRALTRTYPGSHGTYGFSQLLPASAFRPGANQVAVYWVESPQRPVQALAELVRID